LAEFIYSSKTMITILIKDWQWNDVIAINKFTSLSINDEVNKGWTMKLSFSTDERMRTHQIYKWYRITVFFAESLWKYTTLFDWFISSVLVKSLKVEIEAENWLTYLQNRMLRLKTSFVNAEIKYVVSEVFTALNNIKALPITLWLNDCTTHITKDFDIWTSFFDVLKFCWESNNNLIVRVNQATKQLEVSENTWTILDWVWEYDIKFTLWANIVDWEWKDTIDDFYSVILTENWIVQNTAFNNQFNLLFEKYVKEWAENTPDWKAIPSISVSRDTDWWNFYVGDRKQIRLITEYEWLPMSYLWLIQNRKIDINQNGVKATIKVSEKYKSDKNILDVVLTNLRK